MFDQTFVHAGGPTRKPWTVAASLAAQTAVVAVAVMIPILHPGLLQPKIETPIFFKLQKPPELPKIEAAPHTQTQRPSVPRAFVAPSRVPDRITRVVDSNRGTAPPDDMVFAGTGPVGVGQTGNDLFSSLLPTSKPVEQPKVVKQAAPPAPTGPVPVGGAVQAAKLLFGPKPTYPALARAARVQGTVRIQAIIGIDGTISSLQVTAGPGLLIMAAKDAVSRWRYQPTLLNGCPVEVITEIEVNFTLGGS